MANNYLAFISYRHLKADQRFSAFLRRKLEGFHLPKGSPIPKQRRVFRDTDELPTSANLGADIENALENSDWLIALCSEEYLKSKWCQREIELWLEKGRRDKILPVLVSGTEETSKPELIEDIPFIADVRSGSRSAFNNAVVRILARMSGTEEDEIAASERRHNRRVRTSIAAVVLAGLLGFAGFALYTANLIEKGNEQVVLATKQAEEAENYAKEQRNTALLQNADYLAEKSYTAISKRDQEEAVRLALSALPEDLHGDIPVSAEAVGALRAALSMPVQQFELFNTQMTDFTITGCRGIYSNYLFLEGTDPDPLYLKALFYETGEVEDITDDTEKNQLHAAALRAEKLGYRKVHLLSTFTTNEHYWNEIFYGPEGPMRRSFSKPGGDGFEYPEITLNGEPFYADHVIQNADAKFVLAWLAEPGAGQTGHTALFRARPEYGESDSLQYCEALLELDIQGPPLSADFGEIIGSRHDLAVVDSEGILRIYDYYKAKLLKELPGRWSYAVYTEATTSHGSYHRVCAVASDGMSFSILNSRSGEILRTIESPSPVRSAAVCDSKHELLTLCADGARVYSLDDGRLIYEIHTEETPSFAVWGGYIEGRLREDGNQIVLLYNDRIETYQLVTDVNTEISDSIPLYRAGVLDRLEYALYSPDGKTVYLQTWTDIISAWDAGTGRFLWSNNEHTESKDTCIHFVLSEDGRIIWRRNSVTGVEAIDTATGKSLYTIGYHSDCPVLSPDGTLGIAFSGRWNNGKRINIFQGFDTATGEVLWETPGSTYCPVFSEDGKDLYLLDSVIDELNPAHTLTWTCLDAATGKIKNKKEVLQLAEGEDYTSYLSSQSDEKQKLSVIYDTTEEGSSVPAGCNLWVIDLTDGTLLFKMNFPVSDAAVHVSASHEFVISWEEEPEEKYCCVVNRDGTSGEVISTDTEAGRRLMTGVYQAVTFAGDEAYLDSEQANPKAVFQTYTPRTLRRLSDDALLLDAEIYSMAVDLNTSSLSRMRLAGSPAGSSLCVYNEDNTPLLILDSDVDTMVEKAKNYLEGRS